MQAIGSGLERRNGHGAPAVGVVLDRSPGGLGAFLPEAEDGLRGRARLPSRPQAVARGPERLAPFLFRRIGKGLVGRKERRLGLDEAGRRATIPFPALGVPLRSARVIVNAPVGRPL